jgi:branched-subunit amino acid ABC-type transport system permease component
VYRLLDSVIRGVQVGSIYGLVGLGLSIVYSATSVFNFAHGDLVMIGALLGLTLWHRMAWPFLLTMLVVMGTTATMGAATELVAVRGTARLKHASVSWVISTLAVSIIIEATTRYYLFPGSFPPYIHWHSFLIGQQLIIPQRLVLVPIAIAVTAVIALWFDRTLWGRAMSAMASDRDGAAMRGIPVGSFAVFAFVLGGAIAGLAGFVAGPITQASYAVAIPSTLQGFVAATIGGITRTWGPILGGVLLGLAIQFTTVYWNASFTNVVELTILLVVLLARPEGLLGRRVRSV